MRFEIKSGGIVAILFSVAALSGAVFMLGLLAGYDVGRESQSSAALRFSASLPISSESWKILEWLASVSGSTSRFIF